MSSQYDRFVDNLITRHHIATNAYEQKFLFKCISTMYMVESYALLSICLCVGICMWFDWKVQTIKIKMWKSVKMEIPPWYLLRLHLIPRFHTGLNQTFFFMGGGLLSESNCILYQDIWPSHRPLKYTSTCKLPELHILVSVIIYVMSIPRVLCLQKIYLIT